jgi:hypothetical protein
VRATLDHLTGNVSPGNGEGRRTGASALCPENQTALVVGLAAGKLVPELSSGASWPYELLGVGYSLLGIALISYGHRRQNAVEAAVRRGEWAQLDATAAAVLVVVGIVLGAATIAVVVFAHS